MAVRALQRFASRFSNASLWDGAWQVALHESDNNSWPVIRYVYVRSLVYGTETRSDGSYIVSFWSDGSGEVDRQSSDRSGGMRDVATGGRGKGIQGTATGGGIKVASSVASKWQHPRTDTWQSVGTMQAFKFRGHSSLEDFILFIFLLCTINKVNGHVYWNGRRGFRLLCFGQRGVGIHFSSVYFIFKYNQNHSCALNYTKKDI